MRFLPFVLAVILVISPSESRAQTIFSDGFESGDCYCTWSAVDDTTTGVAEGPSCSGGLSCGAASCCDNRRVKGWTLAMGRSDAGTDAFSAGDSDEKPEHDARLSSFALDTYEVTVGRFRRFVEQYDGTPPAEGDGAHPGISGSGWQSAWDDFLPDGRNGLESVLGCSGSYQTWTAAAGANESLPINCVGWYEAFAFCVWDGGRLPTEAEWEHAAAGGCENRLYPWGIDAATAGHSNYSGGANSPFVAVGSYPQGTAWSGHHDLAGSVAEWVLDWYDSAWYEGVGNTCEDCANLVSSTERAIRGGSWADADSNLRAADRSSMSPLTHSFLVGLRCARNLETVVTRLTCDLPSIASGPSF